MITKSETVLPKTKTIFQKYRQNSRRGKRNIEIFYNSIGS